MTGRHCARCGRSYWRANRFRIWIGKHKTDEPICTNCLRDSAANRILVATHIRITTSARSAPLRSTTFRSTGDTKR
jgi:hypothetical protein